VTISRRRVAINDPLVLPRLRDMEEHGQTLPMTRRGALPRGRLEPGSSSSSTNYVLTPLDGGSRTRVEVTADSRGGCLRWGPLVRYAHAASIERLRKKMEASEL
jgi:hypothetical protein